MKKKALLVATELEIYPFIKDIIGDSYEPVKTIENQRRLFFKTYFGCIIVSGIGFFNAMEAVLSHVPNDYDVINIGFAGSVQGNLKVFDICTVKEARIIHMQEKAFRACKYSDQAFPNIDLNTEGFVLGSGICTSYGQDSYNEIDIVDMEGYAIAFACYRRNLNVKIMKIISDILDEDSSDQIKQHKEKLAEKLSFILPSIIDDF